jgi:hypothetical protein
MAQGYKTGGRQKGTPNKMTATARDAIAIAASELGGHGRLVEWAKESPENERAFWVQIYPKLVPVQNEISGPDGGALVTTINLVPLAGVGS